MKLTIFTTPIISPILRFLSNSIMRLVGWRVEGTLPDFPKYLIIGAPHTFDDRFEDRQSGTQREI